MISIQYCVQNPTTKRIQKTNKVFYDELDHLTKSLIEAQRFHLHTSFPSHKIFILIENEDFV